MSRGTLQASPHRFLLLLLILSLGPVLLMLGSAAWFRAYVRGETFHRLLSEATAAALGVEGGFADLEWEGSTIRCSSFTGTGLPDSPVREFTADGLTGVVRLPGLLRWNWRLDELEIQRLTVRLSTPPGLGVAVAPRPILLAAGLGPAPSDSQGPFGIAVVRSFHAQWDLGPQGEGALRDTQVEVESAGGDGIRLRAAGGNVHHAGVGEAGLRLLRAEYDFETAALRIREGRVDPVAGGEIRIRGDAGPWIEPAPPFRCQVDFDGVPLSPWLEPAWRPRLHGLLQGETTWHGTAGDPASVTGKGAVQLVEGVVQNLPLLEQMAILLGDRIPQRFPLHSVETEFHYQRGQLSLQPVSGESPGVARLEGRAVIARGRVNGLFRVGVSEQALRWLPGSRAQVFTEPDGAYHWTDMRVRGPLDAPAEDLSPRVVEAARTGISETLEQGAETALEFLRGLLD